jgi:hypothetical protein
MEERSARKTASPIACGKESTRTSTGSGRGPALSSRSSSSSASRCRQNTRTVTHWNTYHCGTTLPYRYNRHNRICVFLWECILHGILYGILYGRQVQGGVSLRTCSQMVNSTGKPNDVSTISPCASRETLGSTRPVTPPSLPSGCITNVGTVRIRARRKADSRTCATIAMATQHFHAQVVIVTAALCVTVTAGMG